MSRKPYNWSLLDRTSLYNMLYGLKPFVVDRALPARELQKLLRNYIKQQLPVRVKMAQNPKHTAGLVYVGGTYYADYDLAGKHQVEIIFSYKDKGSVIKLTNLRWRRLCLLFADTILHEIIHMRQYRTRDFKAIDGYLSFADKTKDRKDQEYYGHKDEIGAFSFNIACEMYNKFGNNLEAIREYLDSPLIKRNKKLTYYYYLKAFNWDFEHPVIKSLKKKVLRNIQYAEVGKPFKTSNYLTY